jgi:hypothetical protein
MKFFSILFLILSPGIQLSAQTNSIHAEHATGKLVKDKNVSGFIHQFKELSAAKASSLEKTVNDIYATLYKLPQLNPPMGFEAAPHLFINRNAISAPIPSSKVACYFRYLDHDTKTGKPITSKDGTDFNLELNSFDRFFDQLGNFWSDCHKLHFPLFFEQLPITDSNADYLEVNFKSYGYPYVSNNVPNSPIRIVKRNDKPLMIPLTRKEYMQFLIARNQYRIKDNEATVLDEKKQIAETKKNVSDPTYKSVKETLQKAVTTMEAQINKLNEKTEGFRQKIAHLQQLINAMPAQEANAPAHLDYKKRSDEFGGIEQLLPAGSNGGVMLTKINPGYYNRSSNAPVVQLIIVYYSWPVPGYTQPDYLQQETMDMLREIDYHSLKESML